MKDSTTPTGHWITPHDPAAALARDAAVAYRCVDRRDVDAVVAELRRLSQTATMELALTIGRLIIERFYGGSTTAWRQRGRRCASFRKLAARPDLPMSATALYRSVAIYELWERLGAVTTWKHVGACHARAVLGLPPADQERVLMRAESEALTVREVAEVVTSIREQRSDRRGRPRQPPLVRATSGMRRALETFAKVVEDGQLRDAERRELAALRLSLAELRAACDALEDRLRATLPVD